MTREKRARHRSLTLQCSRFTFASLAVSLLLA